MPHPTVKTLSQIHDADHEAMRRILKMNRAELLATDAGAARRRECLAPVPNWDLRMHALNAAARTHGVEGVRASNGWYADYLNTGDSYAPTIIRWNGRYRVQSIGDFIETMERRGIRFD